MEEKDLKIDSFTKTCMQNTIGGVVLNQIINGI